MPGQETVYFDAALTPNRSLSGVAFTLIMAGVAVISFVAGVVFVSMGALPVIGFFGLDALAIWFAFRASFRSQQQVTHVRITAERIDLHHAEPGKTAREASIPTAFARIDLVEDKRRSTQLRISHGQKCWIIGRFLSPEDRVSLAEAIREALRRARLERFASET